MRIFFTCWLDIHSRNLIGSGLLRKLASAFTQITVAVPSTHQGEPEEKNVIFVPGRKFYAGRLFLMLAEFHKVFWILKNNKSETWAAQIRARHGNLFFWAKDHYRLTLIPFFLLAWGRLLLTLPLYRQALADLYVTSTFVWGPYDVFLGLLSRLRGKPWIGLVTGWDNPSTKGRFILEPDRIIVWGEQQVEHAEKYLGIPRSRVTALAPPQFSQLIEARRKLPPSTDPVITYIGVGPLNYPFEEEFVELFLSSLKSQAGISEWKVKVRPHPNDPGKWYEKFKEGSHPGAFLDPAALSRTSAWTVFGVDTEGLKDYFQGIRRSRAIIAHYSTAVLEAGLLGVPSIVPRMDFKTGGEFKTRFDNFVHLEGIRQSPGLLTVRNTHELELALKKLASGFTEEELKEHYRICNHIARIDGIEDLLEEYVSLFRETPRKGKYGD